MKTTSLILFLILVCACSSKKGTDLRHMLLLGTTRSDLLDSVKDWNSNARVLVKNNYDKYGSPDVIGPDMLVWNGRGPFSRTIIYKEGIPHNFPLPHEDVIEQFVPYKVPREKLLALADFDGSIAVHRTSGELSVRCQNELMNTITLNLAQEILTGKMSSGEARIQFERLVKEIAEGKTSTLSEGLAMVHYESTGDADRAVGSRTQAQEEKRVRAAGKD